MMRELWMDVEMGLTLPDAVFFSPKPSFYEWFKRHLGTVIYDVGAGVGQVTAGLQKHGHKCLGLDLHHRDNPQAQVVIANGVLLEYQQESLVMLCRPCHGIFVESVIEQAVQCGASILYVGLEKNVEGDLGLWFDEAKLEVEEVGEAGESIWSIG